MKDENFENRKYISEFKFSNEEIEVMKELFNKLEEVSSVCDKLKSLCSEHEEIKLTCKMWTEMTKSYEELLSESIFIDKAETKIIH